MTRALEGRVAVVTGGASGIGEACVRRLADAGARLAVVDVDAERAREIAASIDSPAGKAKAFSLDVRDAEAVGRIAACHPCDHRSQRQCHPSPMPSGS